jgi:hypothetical protein
LQQKKAEQNLEEVKKENEEEKEKEKDEEEKKTDGEAISGTLCNALLLTTLVSDNIFRC